MHAYTIDTIHYVGIGSARLIDQLRGSVLVAGSKIRMLIRACALRGNERARERGKDEKDETTKMLKAVNEILTDESFQIDLEPCKSAYKQAQDTMKWATDDTNTSQTHQFETALVAMLKKCLPQVIAGSSM